jgi:transcriptional regulator with XRE-family HTH domain
MGWNVDVRLMSPAELGAELGERARRERLRQNMSQATLAERSGVSRLTVTRLEADASSATLTTFLSVLVALQRAGDLEQVLVPAAAETLDQFLADGEPRRQRGTR